MKTYLVYTLVLASLTLVGCQQKGTVEKAGERLDEVIDNVKHGDAPLKEKGTLEKMGQSIDDSLKKDEIRK